MFDEDESVLNDIYTLYASTENYTLAIGHLQVSDIAGERYFCLRLNIGVSLRVSGATSCHRGRTKLATANTKRYTSWK
jgi:hypothetical protein